MTTRLWRGWTAGKDTDAGKRFLRTKLFPPMPGILESATPARRALTR